jgi:hypothetical protein
VSESAQGTTVSFDGSLLGKLRSFRCTPGTAIYEPYITVASTVVGSGVNARVVRQYDCVGIDPGGFDISFFGRAPWSMNNIGMKGMLVVTYASGASRSWEASLETFDDGGEVGNRVIGSARFKLTGG